MQVNARENRHAAGMSTHQHIFSISQTSASSDQTRKKRKRKVSLFIFSWPAMRVISLGIRTVPVLSVTKKLAAPRPSSDSTCRQHVPADEGA